ncbi:OmpH family outer membrane protein [Hymenobacter cellulosilyticus]|uniref:OmpH family outer membrane protein n=1 Tax=Hymenobacter cellulosilyticus TaxID=2932248 RepID=A0A8T9QCC7_9BACT|nr:OmpH family outer membrane protein [Hymenobacter cellulosilyticus]UOQ75196.1 OmpH family outer membrane protein [Hymenobacter cellulosilyticus]
MRRILFCLFVFLSTACKSGTVYINSNKIIEQYHGATGKKQAFLNQAKIWQANLDSLTAEMQAVKGAQAAAKEQQLLQYREAIQQKAQAEEARVSQEILTEINAYIKQYGKEKGYDFILGATDNGNIVYAAEGKDITEEVLAGLNKQYDQQHTAGK